MIRLMSIGFALTVSIVAFAQTSTIPPGPSVLVFDGQYHIAGCSKLKGQSPKTMSLADAIRAGIGPCDVCAPNDHDNAIRSFVVNYTVAISREMEPARLAAAAERRRLADEAAAVERKRTEAAAAAAAAEGKRRADAAAAERAGERKRVEAAAVAERKRKEAEPLVRVTELQARAVLVGSAA